MIQMTQAVKEKKPSKRKLVKAEKVKKALVQRGSDAVILWVRKNHGILTRIAREQDVSRAYVSVLLNGYSSGGYHQGYREDGSSRRPAVEAALRSAGAPI